MVPIKRPIHLLLVEDSPSDATLIRVLLEADYPEQYLLEVAPSLQEAQAAILKHDYSAILLDLSLPDSQGIKTVERLIKTARSIPIIVLTGNGDEEAAAEAVRCGAQDYLRKGFSDAASIAKAIRYAIDRKLSEEARRKSESQYRNLFTEMLSGFAVHEIICDSTGHAVDYVTLEVNASFESLLNTPAAAIIGKKASEILPPEELNQWLEIFGPVALTGKSTRYEIYSPSAKKHFAGTAYCPDKGRFAVTFADITDHKRADEARRESEQKFAKAFMASPEAMLIASLADGTYVDVNEAFVKATGFAREEVIGRTSSDLKVWVDPQERQRYVEQLRAAGRVRGFEAQYRMRDGEIRDFMISSEVVWINSLECSLNFVFDITDRKRAEEQLRVSEAALRQAQKVAHVGNWVWHIQTNSLDWSDEMYRLFGIDKASFSEDLSEVIARAIHPDDRDKVNKANQYVIHNKKHAPLEYRVVWPDQSVHIVWAEAGELTLDRSGNPVILTGIVQDITDRKWAEEALLESRHFVQRVLDTTPTLIYIYDIVNHRNVYANRDVVEFLGYTPEQIKALESTLMHNVLHPEDADLVAKHHARCALAADGEVLNIEYRMKHSSGQWRWLRSCDVVFARNPDGMVLSILGSTEDITNRKQAEEESALLQAQLLQAQKMEAVGRLAAGVAHDFNNQLTVIQGYADMLLTGCTPDDPLWDPLSEIRRAGERAHSTTSHLLSFSRKQMLHPELCDVNGLLIAMRGPVATMIGEDIKFNVIADPGARPVLIDPAGMHQAIMNLIVNARDAMPNGGELVLRTQNFDIGHAGSSWFLGAVAGQYTLVEVRDSGVGMNRETLEHVFDPFFTTKAVGEGTGLGLPMVQGFVKQSHGFIDIRSEPGKGTVVRILLPAAGEAPLEVQGARCEATVHQARCSKTILVVEDEKGIRNLIVRCLRADGYEVLEASTPSQAIAIVTQHEGPLDLLITDIVMPEMNGADLAKRVESICKPIRTLFITGYANEEVRTSVRNVLLKPFSMDALLGAVRETLGRRESCRKS